MMTSRTSDTTFSLKGYKGWSYSCHFAEEMQLSDNTVGVLNLALLLDFRFGEQ